MTVWFLLLFAGVVVANANASGWQARAAISSTADAHGGVEFAIVHASVEVGAEAPRDLWSSHDMPRYWRVGRGDLPAPRAP